MNQVRTFPSHLVAGALALHAFVIGGALLYLGQQIRDIAAPAHGQLLPSSMRPTDIAHAIPTSLAVANAPAASAPTVDLSRLRTSTRDDYVYGSRKAEVSLIAFMDFECPYCARFYPSAKQFVDDSNGKVNLVVRLYPLAFHKHAQALATAADCVGQQKGSVGYFAFAQGVYQQEGGIPGDTESFIRPIVAGIGVDMAQLHACMQSRDAAQKVDASTSEGKAIGIMGTPSMVLYDAATRKSRFIFGTKDVAQLQDAARSVTD